MIPNIFISFTKRRTNARNVLSVNKQGGDKIYTICWFVTPPACETCSIGVPVSIVVHSLEFRIRFKSFLVNSPGGEMLPLIFSGKLTCTCTIRIRLVLKTMEELFL